MVRTWSISLAVTGASGSPFCIARSTWRRSCVSGTKSTERRTAASDPQSGIVKYYYAIGTTTGGTDIVNWTDNALSTSVTKTGLTLTGGAIYYFTVKSENGVGLQSVAANSNGVTIDVTPPSSPVTVNDGSSADIQYTGLTSQLTANWTAGADAQSGIAKYWYAIGTTSGATDVTNGPDADERLYLLFQRQIRKRRGFAVGARYLRRPDG